MNITSHEIAVKRPPKRHEAEIFITALIDITILLLGYFILCSTVDSSAAVDEPLARNGIGVPERLTVPVVVAPSDGELPVVYLGGHKNAPKAEGDLASIEQQIEQYVHQELLNAEKTTVLIKAEKHVKVRHLQTVKAAVSRALDDDQSLHIGVVSQ
jgi:biopolymer transport protein ExbD